MPVYEYYCEACNYQFEKILTLAEHENSIIVCPRCGSAKSHQRMTTFTAVTGKKS